MSTFSPKLYVPIYTAVAYDFVKARQGTRRTPPVYSIEYISTSRTLGEFMAANSYKLYCRYVGCGLPEINTLT